MLSKDTSSYFLDMFAQLSKFFYPNLLLSFLLPYVNLNLFVKPICLSFDVIYPLRCQHIIRDSISSLCIPVVLDFLLHAFV